MTTLVCLFQNCFRVEDKGARPQEFLAPMSPQTIGLETHGRDEKDQIEQSTPTPQYCDDNVSTEGTRDAADLNSMTSKIEGFRYMLRKIFQTLIIEDGPLQETHLQNSSQEKFEKAIKEAGKSDVSPLRIATSYSSLHDCPSIAPEEVVIPGSILQKQMSLSLQDKGILAESSVDECVICMETFDASNPKMPTLCGCGENMTLFHLPCLYQWVEKCRDCPSCRRQLNWQEL
jgi:hypothetical protein